MDISRLTRDRAYAIIDQAKNQLLQWAQLQRIAIHTIEYVAVFENWTKDIGVWIFFETDKELRSCEHSSLVDQIKTQYLCILRELNYPFDLFPNVIFQFDSHENVQRNYQGSYFYRLR
jgi:hypothetical protein